MEFRDWSATVIVRTPYVILQTPEAGVCGCPRVGTADETLTRNEDDRMMIRKKAFTLVELLVVIANFFPGPHLKTNGFFSAATA